MIGTFPWVDRIVPILERLVMPGDMRSCIQEAAVDIVIAYVRGLNADHPSRRRVGTVKATRQMSELRDSLLAVRNAIQALRFEAKSAIVTEILHSWKNVTRVELFGISVAMDRVPHLAVFESEAKGLITLIDVATSKMLADPNTTQAGRPRKNAGTAVAREAAKIYEQLTGNKPTVTTGKGIGHKASGEFLEFVRALFSALEIDASPESRIKAVIKSPN